MPTLNLNTTTEQRGSRVTSIAEKV